MTNHYVSKCDGEDLLVEGDGNAANAACAPFARTHGHAPLPPWRQGHRQQHLR